MNLKMRVMKVIKKLSSFCRLKGGVIVISPKEDAQDHDTFISLTGTLYVIVNSRKDKGTCVVIFHMLKYGPAVQILYDRSNE